MRYKDMNKQTQATNKTQLYKVVLEPLSPQNFIRKVSLLNAVSQEDAINQANKDVDAKNFRIISCEIF
jgi:hypothetical protein